MRALKPTIEDRPLQFILNSKQSLMQNFVSRLVDDGVDFAKSIVKQAEICKVITVDEFWKTCTDGACNYVLVIDDEGICHAVIGRVWPDEDEYDELSDDMPMSRTCVLETLGPKTIRGTINHAVKFNRHLLRIDTVRIVHKDKYRQNERPVNAMHKFEQDKHRREELVRQIKLVKILVQVFAIADEQSIDLYAQDAREQFEAALPPIADKLAELFSQKFNVKAEINDIKITDFENDKPALFVEFRMPCTINGKYNRWASCLPQTLGCRYIADKDRPAFMLKRSAIAMLQPLSFNINDRALQCTMQNLANNLVRKDDVRLTKFIPEQYRQVLCS